MDVANISMDNTRKFIIHPYRFNLWLFILSLVMIFGGLTSAYIVSLGSIPSADRTIIDLLTLNNNPLASLLLTNLIVILLSSAGMQYAIWTGRKGQNKKALFGLVLTFALGAIFLAGQVKAWDLLTQQGLPLVDPARRDNSAPFLIVISFLHGLHIVGALIVLLVVMFRTSLNQFREGGSSKKLTFELTGTFWHFLGLLWIYLYLVLVYSQQTYV